LRIGTLSLGIPSPALGKGKDYRGLRTASRTGPHAATATAIAITGMDDRDPVDQVIAIKVITMHRITQRTETGFAVRIIVFSTAAAMATSPF